MLKKQKPDRLYEHQISEEAEQGIDLDVSINLGTVEVFGHFGLYFI